MLEAASAELAKAPLSLAFTSGIVGGIDYANALNALIARYALMVGDYTKAISAADLVLKSSRSGYRHDDISRNALFESAFSNRNVTEPQDGKFGLPAGLQTPPTDKRIAFFINTTAGVNKARASFFVANGTTLPIYRVGEMYLIKAEAFLRKSPADLPSAIVELNRVLTKKPADDPWGIGADLPPYAGAVTEAAVLEEIYRQRSVELYLGGLRFEDNRRFGRPIAERGNRNFMPYPFTERDNNTSTPQDPLQ
jgi:hypothetical protein